MLEDDLKNEIDILERNILCSLSTGYQSDECDKEIILRRFEEFRKKVGWIT